MKYILLIIALFTAISNLNCMDNHHQSEKQISSINKADSSYCDSLVNVFTEKYKDVNQKSVLPITRILDSLRTNDITIYEYHRAIMRKLKATGFFKMIKDSDNMLQGVEYLFQYDKKSDLIVFLCFHNKVLSCSPTDDSTYAYKRDDYKLIEDKMDFSVYSFFKPKSKSSDWFLKEYYLPPVLYNIEDINYCDSLKIGSQSFYKFLKKYNEMIKTNILDTIIQSNIEIQESISIISKTYPLLTFIPGVDRKGILHDVEFQFFYDDNKCLSVYYCFQNKLSSCCGFKGEDQALNVLYYDVREKNYELIKNIKDYSVFQFLQPIPDELYFKKETKNLKRLIKEYKRKKKLK